MPLGSTKSQMTLANSMNTGIRNHLKGQCELHKPIPTSRVRAWQLACVWGQIGTGLRPDRRLLHCLTYCASMIYLQCKYT